MAHSIRTVYLHLRYTRRKSGEFQNTTYKNALALISDTPDGSRVSFKVLPIYAAFMV
jgi:hypothetical protein